MSIVEFPGEPLSPQSRLVAALRDVAQGHIVVVTGAGVSLASGIPTFRGSDPDAVWQKDVTELGTRRYFEDDPKGSWLWYSSRFAAVHGKLPNPAHTSLAAIERWQLGRGGRFLLVTQNIDTLHEAAGSQNLIKVHGSSDQVRCSRYGCENGAPDGSLQRDSVDMERFLATPSDATLPRCPACSSLLRQHVLWFDEYYDEHESYAWSRVVLAGEDADLVLFVGTSFAVGVTDLFLRSAVRRQIPAFAVDPGASNAPHSKVTLLAEPGEVLLPAIAANLQAQ